MYKNKIKPSRVQEIRIKIKRIKVSHFSSLTGPESTWLNVKCSEKQPSSSSFQSDSGHTVDVNNWPACRVDFECTIGWQLVHHFSGLLCENGVLFQLRSRYIENLLKWIHLAPKRKWTPKCHILWDIGCLWDVCMGSSPVGCSNQTAGISWQS